MEEGGKVGADALMNTPGGGSVGGAMKSTSTIENGVKTMTIGSGPMTMPAATPKALTFVKDEKCQALWTDGKYYPAQVMKVDGPKYTVKYLEYGNTAIVQAKQMKKADAAPAVPTKGGKVAQGKVAGKVKA
jgi:hypothetical protein